MIPQSVPNTQVWLLGREYLEAAEILLDYNRFQSSVILAALALEIFLKSFLAVRDGKGNSATSKLHPLMELFNKIEVADRDEIKRCSKELDSLVDFESNLGKFDRILVAVILP